MNNLRILVTGGAGFIGSNIVEELVGKAKHIRVLDNLSTGKKDNLKGFSGVEFMYGDISDLETCRMAVKGMDVICHQAALGSVPRSISFPLQTHVSNVTGFLNVLAAAKEVGIKRIVFASSSSVYGDSETLPKVEGEEGSLLSPYAASKYIDEIYADVFNRCYGMECIGLRYFNVFGPRQDPQGPYAAVIPKFISLMKAGEIPVINGDGLYSRDFTFVKNVVWANILALTVNVDGPQVLTVYNIGTGGSVTMNELVAKINEILGLSIVPYYGSVREGDIPHSNANIGKAADLLGYSPNIPFGEGLHTTINSMCKKE
jgi:UDP-N-acetylglucosamine/UDP-N-acetylgalactosamine 4-epimerase